MWSFPQPKAFVGVFLTSKATFWRKNGILTVSAEGKQYPVHMETLPKALRTQGLTTLTSCFGLVWWVWYGRFGLVGLVW